MFRGVLVGLCLLAVSAAQAVNERPIIGILTLPNYHPEYPSVSFLVASYVKWIESGGARVVPILYNSTTEELQTTVSYVNGVLFTGGGTGFVNPNGSLTQFAAAAQTVFNAVLAQNKAGNPMPLYAICLGFQLVNFLVAGANSTMVSPGFDSDNLTLPLDFTADGPSSRMMEAAGPDIVAILGNEPVTMNNHIFGVTPENFFTNPYLPSFFKVVSTNTDRKGREFISTLEAFDFPIYISQWHPEKVQFEWYSQEGINHSYDSVQANSFFARFFVNTSRSNSNHFPSAAAAVNALIYNYQPVYTGPTLGEYEQCYFF